MIGTEQGISGKPFSIHNLKLTQDFGAELGVKKEITKIPFDKPNKQVFFRIRPGEDWCAHTYILNLKNESEKYLVDKPLWHELASEITPMALFTGITRQENLFLWPIPLPDRNGKHNSYHQSAFQAASRAMTDWIRLKTNQPASVYDVMIAQADYGEPEWPDMSLDDIIQLAFKGRFIDTMEHPVVRKLQGLS